MTKEIWEIDINKSYIVDEDLNVFDDYENFNNYYLEEYTGIKDNIEQFYENMQREKKASEIKGNEVIAILWANELEMREYWKNKYYEILEKEEK
jgi:hypothetical protein